MTLAADLARDVAGLLAMSSGGVSNTPLPNATDELLGQAEARLLSARVDALTVAFRVVVSPETLNVYESHRQRARDLPGQRVAFCLDRRRSTQAPIWSSEVERWTFAVDHRRPSNGYAVRLVNSSATVLVMSGDEHDDEGRSVGPKWCVEVSLRAAFLATHTLAEATWFARELARRAACAGDDGDGWIYAERLRRVDLAADADPGEAFQADDRGSFVGRPRKVTDYLPEQDDLASSATRTHWTKGVDARVTGFSFAMGSPLSARLYDKCAELDRYEEGNEKRAIEHASWARAGWCGSSVWRLEFQFRREALEQAVWLDGIKPRRGVHTLDDLAKTLDGLWQYSTHHWLRCVERDSATRRHRATTQQRWKAYQMAKFTDKNTIRLKRERLKRGGVELAQSRGCVLSTLASSGGLPRVAEGGDAASILDEARRACVADAMAFAEELSASIKNDADAAAYLEQRRALEARFSLPELPDTLEEHARTKPEEEAARLARGRPSEAFNEGVARGRLAKRTG